MYQGFVEEHQTDYVHPYASSNALHVDNFITYDQASSYWPVTTILKDQRCSAVPAKAPPSTIKYSPLTTHIEQQIFFFHMNSMPRLMHAARVLL